MEKISHSPQLSNSNQLNNKIEATAKFQARAAEETSSPTGGCKLSRNMATSSIDNWLQQNVLIIRTLNQYVKKKVGPSALDCDKSRTSASQYYSQDFSKHQSSSAELRASFFEEMALSWELETPQLMQCKTQQLQ